MFISDTKEQVLEKFKSIHGDRYDYSLVEYVGSRFKVKIICKEHGIFECSPSNHLKKDRPRGCPKCGIIKCSKNRSKTTEQFVKEAIDVNGNEYDYTLVDYIGDKHKVAVICRKHGEFLVTPNNHLKGKGCPACGKEKISISKRQCGSDVVNRFKEQHGDKYDYSLVEYKSATVKVKIICPIHGVFEQTPSGHYNGQGCPMCGIKKQAKKKQINPPGWSITNWENKAKKSKNFDSFKVYIIRCWNDNEEFYKIGRTFTSVYKRFAGENMPYKYEILEEIIFDNARDCFNKETDLKRINKEFKYLPKIKFYGMHECFVKKIIIKNN